MAEQSFSAEGGCSLHFLKAYEIVPRALMDKEHLQFDSSVFAA